MQNQIHQTEIHTLRAQAQRPYAAFLLPAAFQTSVPARCTGSAHDTLSQQTHRMFSVASSLSHTIFVNALNPSAGNPAKKPNHVMPQKANRVRRPEKATRQQYFLHLSKLNLRKKHRSAPFQDINFCFFLCCTRPMRKLPSGFDRIIEPFASKKCLIPFVF